MNFLRGKCMGRVGGGTKLASPAPVILGLVPKILLQQYTNLVNKLALLLNKCWLSIFCTFFKYPSPDAKASPSPARGEGSGLLRCYTPRNDGRAESEIAGLLLCVLLPKVSFFLPNPAKTC